MIDRPLIHFAPQRHWMNDPNGLVFHDGRYHLFFQHNPHGMDHGTIGWGHASSTDLVHWDEHPLAIAADDREQIFSGSAVVDVENTSGFAGEGETALVAIYTSFHAETGMQTQALAFSVDDGMTWAKYADNPVLDRGSLDFRDPKVFRYEGPAGAYWVMVAVEALQRQIVLYRSDDLRAWTLLSTYGPAGAVGGVWECPDLFPLELDGNPDDVRWVLVISLNPGGLMGGSGTQYVVGQFDGVTFTADGPVSDALDEIDWIDFGRDCYAGVTFSGLPARERTLIAWMNNWDYARALPTSPWRGAMTVARRLSLATVDGRPQLRAEPLVPAGEPVDPASGLPAAARIDARVRLGSEPGAAARIDIVGSAGRVSIRCEEGRLTVDRTAAAAFDTDARIHVAPLPASGGVVDLVIVIDTCSIEVFAGSGVRSITDLVVLGDGCRLETVTEGGAAFEQFVVAEAG